MSEAKQAVLKQLELAYERYAVDEQLARATDPVLAEDFHRFGVMVLRARLAEDEDPKPPEPCSCIRCAALYAASQ